LEGQNSGGCPNIITGRSTKPPPDSSLVVRDEVDASFDVMGVAGTVKNTEDSHTDAEENSREKLIDEEPPADGTDKHHTHNDHLNLLTTNLDCAIRSWGETN
jgi:hypothetical protein